MEKIKWTRPQLVVLTRGKPEESVLVLCKNGILGPNEANAMCSVTPADDCNSVCNDFGPS